MSPPRRDPVHRQPTGDSACSGPRGTRGSSPSFDGSGDGLVPAGQRDFAAPHRPLGGGDASEASLKVTTRAGRVGGELGRPVETPAGGGLMFRRFGDDLTGVVSEDLALLIGTRAAELWSPVVQDLDVLVQKHLEITGTVDGEERTLRFERNENDGLWYRAGTRIEAPSDFTAYCVVLKETLTTLHWPGMA